MSGAVASLDRVSKRFGDRIVLEDVSFGVEPGSILAVLGPNGAGKTTSLSILLGLRRADAGRAQLFGKDPRTPGARRLLGSTPQELSFPATLRVVEIVDLVRAHYPRPAASARLLSEFGLEALSARQAGGLSGGEKRRLAVALAFAGSPELVVLDEPTTGLDVDARRSTWNAVRSYAATGGAVILTTHYLEEAEALATAMLLLERGSVVAAGRTDEIRAAAGLSRISFRHESLPSLAGLRRERDGELDVIDSSDPAETLRTLLDAGAHLEQLEVVPLPLEAALARLSERS